ncbi:hypothetical protein CH063_13877 [Colletotrichum higginsianum]|uniref:Uncharacterized protein n=1 Tax=Colletotrichum higginsianum (strain IMI 349063) TaxID=759273 RepID=H1VW91_COLHI|nr:hypothetical protein CH063_13877 [Colletotrichum higginsianum]
MPGHYSYSQCRYDGHKHRRPFPHFPHLSVLWSDGTGWGAWPVCHSVSDGSTFLNSTLSAPGLVNLHDATVESCSLLECLDNGGRAGWQNYTVIKAFRHIHQLYHSVHILRRESTRGIDWPARIIRTRGRTNALNTNTSQVPNKVPLPHLELSAIVGMSRLWLAVMIHTRVMRMS